MRHSRVGDINQLLKSCSFRALFSYSQAWWIIAKQKYWLLHLLETLLRRIRLLLSKQKAYQVWRNYQWIELTQMKRLLKEQTHHSSPIQSLSANFLQKKRKNLQAINCWIVHLFQADHWSLLWVRKSSLQLTQFQFEGYCLFEANLGLV